MTTPATSPVPGLSVAQVRKGLAELRERAAATAASAPHARRTFRFDVPLDSLPRQPGHVAQWTAETFAFAFVRGLIHKRRSGNDTGRGNKKTTKTRKKQNRK